MGVLALARLARNSRRLVRFSKIRRPNVRERSGAPCFRKIRFSGATENVVAEATRSRRRADVRLGFHSFRGAARECRSRAFGEARESGARSGTVDFRVRNAMTFWGARDAIRRVVGGIVRARIRG